MILFNQSDVIELSRRRRSPFVTMSVRFASYRRLGIFLNAKVSQQKTMSDDVSTETIYSESYWQLLDLFSKSSRWFKHYLECGLSAYDLSVTNFIVYCNWLGHWTRVGKVWHF